jgi:diguanylate cyclase (GGDEF)-like protein
VLQLNIALGGAAIIGFFIVLFYGLFRSALNLRFRDPSLTTEMIAAAVLTLAFVMYHAAPVRNALSLFYLVALMFGVLRLGTARLLALAMVALVAHAAVLALSGSLNGPGAAAGWTQLATLAIVLPWFAAMGGYVNRLRHRLSDSNRLLRDANLRIEQIAQHDELTGVFNRRYLIAALERERSRALRLGAPLCACLIDIDHFKGINDRWGHAAGDAVLKHFVVIAAAELRGADVFGRYGGEEFLLMMPDTDVLGALAVAERIRRTIGDAGFPQMSPERPVTVTIGVAALAREEPIFVLLERADEALYRGKEAGRNRVVAAG